MNRTVIWIVGEPGVGKTTFARNLIASLCAPEPTKVELQNPKWTIFDGKVAAAGWWRRGIFDGSDTLPINQIKPAIVFWACHLTSVPYAILDGDKLATTGAVAVAQERGARLVCFRLRGLVEAAQRRLERGSKQNESWIKGRRTKSRNFADRFPGEKFIIPADMTPEAAIKEARWCLDSGGDESFFSNLPAAE